MNGYWIGAVVFGLLTLVVMYWHKVHNRHYNMLMDTPERRWPKDDADWARAIGFEAYLVGLERMRTIIRVLIGICAAISPILFLIGLIK